MKSHYVASYEAHVAEAYSRFKEDARAMAYAVGDNFQAFGTLQKYLLQQYGLTPQSSIIDIGCGSGRLAYALRTYPHLKYLGTDVVDRLLAHAARVTERPDWTFLKSTDLKIPAPDSSADLVSAFSVFTHLLHEETYVYLQEVKRVLKPGGRLVFSFLDFSVPAHWTVFEGSVANVHQRSVLNQFMDATAIRVWSEHLGLNVVAIHPGYEPYVTLPEPVQLDDGSVWSDKASLGQSACVLQKPL
jgi:ubiquinone/menaquinone biosynthesis C-methylase UbiE